jgi:lysophospholipase L1-like esterase
VRKILIKRKLLALFFGMVVTFLVIEVGLRIAGKFRSTSIEKQIHQIAPGTEILILCTGDSHTFGVGAPEGFDYPSFLSTKLGEIFPNNSVHIVNLGKAGSNSSEAVERVLSFIEQSKMSPDLVIFQAGKNNDHNFRHASIFSDVAMNDNFMDWAKYLLSNSRTFRLSQISLMRLSDLAFTKDPDQVLHHDYFLDVQGKGENALLTQWITKDIQNLKAGYRGKLLLLNYYIPIDWVDQVYESLSDEKEIPWADIRDFGMPGIWNGKSVDENLNLPDLHPNAKGYALTADLVIKSIKQHGLLPIPD